MSDTLSEDTRIQLLVSRDKDESGLREMLSVRYDVVVDDTLQPVSCYLVEDRQLLRYSDALWRKKQAAHPTFCPVLLLKRNGSQSNVDHTQIGDSGEQSIVDDVVIAPVDKQVILPRIENLRVRRAQSVALTSQYEHIEEQYEQLFAAAKDAILVTDAESSKIVECNRSASELFGYSQFRLQGKNPSRFFERDGDRDFESFVQRVLEAEKGVTESLTCKTKWGQSVEVEVSATSVERAVGESVMLFIRDISDRIRREKQIRVLNRVLRHNMRNSMNVIHGYAELVSESAENEVPEEYAQKIAKKSSSLIELSEKSRIVNDVLQQSSERYSLDVVKLLEEIRDDLSVEQPDARVHVTTPEEAHVLADKHLKTALRELCQNAIIHCEDPQPLVEISVTEAQGEVEIRIEDRGTGISEQELAMLEGEETALRHGSGLGLWLVSSIVGGLGGVLEISSADPCGTVVTVTLQQFP